LSYSPWCTSTIYHKAGELTTSVSFALSKIPSQSNCFSCLNQLQSQVIFILSGKR